MHTTDKNDSTLIITHYYNKSHNDININKKLFKIDYLQLHAEFTTIFSNKKYLKYLRRS